MRPHIYRAPSWSWASLDRFVVPGHLGGRNGEGDLIPTCLDASIDHLGGQRGCVRVRRFEIQRLGSAYGPVAFTSCFLLGKKPIQILFDPTRFRYRFLQRSFVFIYLASFGIKRDVLTAWFSQARKIKMSYEEWANSELKMRTIAAFSEAQIGLVWSESRNF